MPFIIYPQADNKLAVIIPTGDVEDCIKDVPAETPYAIVDDLSHIDNDYFDGYSYDNGTAVPNISTVQEIHLNKWREARKPLLDKLDISYIKALESSNTTALQSITQQKQALRDITKISLPNTSVEDIKSVWPDILN
jgi:hypothetical protein